MNKTAVLIFGGSSLQASIVEVCNAAGLHTVVIDPDPQALAKKTAHYFEVVSGDDFEGTCEVIEKYNIRSLITAATDKPLLMMSRVAEKYSLPFFSETTARLSTDKLLMKETFIRNGIPCANGQVVEKVPATFGFPVVVKPRDNSGSRGVRLCLSESDCEKAIEDALSYSKEKSVLVEEFVEGDEYSVESLHFNNESHVIQITEKQTGPLPYFVETSHIQPASLSNSDENKIRILVEKIASCFQFVNCASHIELKIKNDRIVVIEVSPRLGGDYITSKLVPLSTGINMEKALVDISLGITPKIEYKQNKSSGIFYFSLNPEKFQKLLQQPFMTDNQIDCYSFDPDTALKNGSKIYNSSDRCGYIIFSEKDKESLIRLKNSFFNLISKL